MDKVADEIMGYNKAYMFLVDCAEYYYSINNIDKTLLFCQHAASYATFMYCGFYADSKLEKLLLSLGKELVTKNAGNSVQKKLYSDKKKVLHYATSIHKVGGHTRLIENWIVNDTESIHDVVLTAQNEVIPEFINSALALVKGKIINLTNDSVIVRATELFQLANEYDIIILHHHANDLVPVLSFSSSMSTPVCVLNHGDHRFWLGALICDNLIEIRENLIEVDRVRRMINNFSLLPIPIKEYNLTENQRKESRIKLGLHDNEIMLLSIGASYKYNPIDERNFFNDVLPALSSNDNVVKLFIVGINQNEQLALDYKGKNIFFIAPTPDLSDYKNACDIYLEGYPFSSFTAYLEVAALGKPVQRMYNPPVLNEYNIFSYPNKIVYPSKKEDWLKSLKELINDGNKRLELGKAEKENSVLHSVAAWKVYLSAFYNHVQFVNHEVKDSIGDNIICLDENDTYLYKMQLENRISYSLNVFYDLPVHLKIRLVFSDYLERLCGNTLKFKDKIWFILKSHKINS